MSHVLREPINDERLCQFVLEDLNFKLTDLVKLASNF
jgi:hypothetical protein